METTLIDHNDAGGSVSFARDATVSSLAIVFAQSRNQNRKDAISKDPRLTCTLLDDMLVGLTIKNFKGIRHLDRMPLSAFHVLVGPNGSGKSTFFEAVDFVRDCLEFGPKSAVEQRNIADFNDITWMRGGGSVEIDLWMDFGAADKRLVDSLLRYHLKINQTELHGVCVEGEDLRQFPLSKQSRLFPLHYPKNVKGKRILGKTASKTDVYSRDTGTYQDTFNFGLDKLTLSHTPPDEEKYHTANTVKNFLMQGVRFVQLNSAAMRLPCPATRGTELDLDGTNLARVVGKLLGAGGTKKGTQWPSAQNTLTRWAQHLQYALPDLVAIGWDKRQADNAEYLILRYANSLDAPSWLLSDGTLRMLALTLPAFLPSRTAIYMVEEPENGVHPKALEIILRSLSAIPGGQMLVATHSPFVVTQVGVEPLLCFTRGRNGVEVVPGPEHPRLQKWEGTPDLGLIFAAGLLE